MTRDENVALLRDAFGRERRAIAAMDASSLFAIAEEKESLFAALVASTKDDPTFAPVLRDLVLELRRNAVLLAHGRDILEDVTHALQATGHGGRRGPRLAVRG
ncbi:MAG: hypothetical protein U0169_09770 [Polyangiaceae bacterium]